MMQGESYVKKVWGSTVKAWCGSFAAMVFGVAILAISVFAAMDPAKVYPSTGTEAEPGEMRVMATVGQATISGQTAKIEYYLPYPGLLPDSPVYKLKAARDRIWLWLTFDPMKKAEKELLYADKRINAGWVLIEGGKQGLGVSTVTKAEKYLESSVNRAIGLADRGKDVKSLLLLQGKAAAKHEEVLKIMIEKISGTEKIPLEKTLELTQMLMKNIGQALVESQ